MRLNVIYANKNLFMIVDKSHKSNQRFYLKIFVSMLDYNYLLYVLLFLNMTMLLALALLIAAWNLYLHMLLIFKHMQIKYISFILPKIM